MSGLAALDTLNTSLFYRKVNLTSNSFKPFG